MLHLTILSTIFYISYFVIIFYSMKTHFLPFYFFSIYINSKDLRKTSLGMSWLPHTHHCPSKQETKRKQRHQRQRRNPKSQSDVVLVALWFSCFSFSLHTYLPLFLSLQFSKMRRSSTRKTGQSNSAASVNSSATDLFRSGGSSFSDLIY